MSRRKFAKRNKLESVNHFGECPAHFGGDNIRVDILTQEQAQELRDSLKGQYALIWDIGYSTGLRISDILQLTVKQCSSAQAYITEKKTKKKRRIYIAKSIRAAVKARAKKLGLSPWSPLFDVSRQSVWKTFKRAAARSSIDTNIGTHTMRKSYSKKYIQKGHTITELQQRLNHSHYGDTIGYITSNKDMGLDNEGKPKKRKRGKKNDR